MEDVEVEKDLGEKGILTKVKKPRTEKQIEAFKKASAIRDANRNKRKEDGKKEMEEKILFPFKTVVNSNKQIII